MKQGNNRARGAARNATRFVIVAWGISTAATLRPASAQTISVQVNGEPVVFSGARPQRIYGRVMVPMRDIFQALGASVHWDPQARTVRADRGVNRVEMALGARSATLNGREIGLDWPAVISRGSTYVPLRFVAESLGSVVNWDGARNAILITDSGAGTTSTASTSASGDGPDLQTFMRGKNLSPMKVTGSFAAPVNGATVSELPRIKGTAMAVGNGTISRVGVQLLRAKGGRGYDFWTPGIGWRPREFTIKANYDAGSGEWEVKRGLPTVRQLPPGNYVMNSIAYDQSNRPTYVALGELTVVR